MNVARRYFKHVNPSDYEFLAMIGIALWNEGRFFDLV